MRMKGKLKPVDSLDEACIVLVEDKFSRIDTTSESLATFFRPEDGG